MNLQNMIIEGNFGNTTPNNYGYYNQQYNPYYNNISAYQQQYAYNQPQYYYNPQQPSNIVPIGQQNYNDNGYVFKPAPQSQYYNGGYYGGGLGCNQQYYNNGHGYNNGYSGGSDYPGNSSNANNSGIASDISDAFSDVIGDTEKNVDSIKSILENIYKKPLLR